jgi:D-lactate dehydrogenase (cytochrome)
MLDTVLKPLRVPTQFTLIDSKRAKEIQLENQPEYGTLQQYEQCIADITTYFTRRRKEDKVSTDEADLTTHGISDWSYHEEKRPTVVVWVDSTDEVKEIVRIATMYKVPITPFSGGTSLEGHFSSVSRVPLADADVVPGTSAVE